MKSAIRFVATFALCGLVVSQNSACAQATAFTYQGRLAQSGALANGTYNLSFALFGSSNGGPQIGNTITTNFAITNGVFTVALDFGANFPGPDRWLEISVASGANPPVTLAPRQMLTPTPYAVTAGGLAGPLSSAQLSGIYGNQVTFNNGADNFNGTFTGQFLGYSFIGGGFTGTFVGNGSGLVALNAGQLASGVVPPAQMGSLTNHSDVLAQGGLATGQVLVYGGSVWTNAPLSAPLPPVSLAYSGTNVPVSAALGNYFRLTATGNFMLQNPSGGADGQRVTFEIIQDATGGRTMTFGNAYKFGTDLPVVNLSTNAGLRDFITCVCSGTNFYVVGFIKGF
ncbi:MAG TPA: hypothetical protein VN281_16305 [Verrucomicrobiae bacterium]|nr:hypothetical protein [Verrucomicrobiae bacterium]